MKGRLYIKKFLNALGLDVRKYPDFFLRKRLEFISKNKIDIVIDVGANVGQFGKEMRALGYKGKIISFEPLKDAFEKLKIEANKDFDWEVYNLGVGSEMGKLQINVAQNSFSSSFLGMTDAHVHSAPNSVYVSTQEVEIVTLNPFLEECIKDYKSRRVYLKIDTQGYEYNVLLGLGAKLKNILAVQVEMSLEKVYEGAPSFIDLYSYIIQYGFKPFSFEPGFLDKETGRLLQMDGIFVNERFL